MTRSFDSSPMPSDAALVLRAQEGDRDAFTALIDRHLRPLYGMAIATVGAQEAEDLVQETLLAAWGRLTHLSEPNRFGTWVGGILRRYAQKHHRGKARQQRALRVKAARSPAAVPQEDAMEREEAVRRVEEALSRLPEPLRLPLVLFHLEGESTQTVAERLGLRPPAVRKRLERARRLLKDRLDPGLLTAFAVLAPPPALRARLVEGITAAPPLVEGALAGKTTSLTSALTGGLLVSLKTKTLWIVLGALVLISSTVLLISPGGLGILSAPISDSTPPPRLASDSAEAALSREAARKLALADDPTPEDEEAGDPAVRSIPARTEDAALLQGRVLEHSQAKPIAGAKVTVEGIGPSSSTETDGSFYASLLLPESPRFSSVIVEHPEHARRVIECGLVAGKEVNLGDIRLVRVVPVEVVVTTAGGEPPDRIELEWRGVGWSDEELEPVPLSFEAGEAAQLPVPCSKSVVIRARASGFREAESGPLFLAAGDSPRVVRLQLEPVAPEKLISGRVEGMADPSGAGAIVRVRFPAFGGRATQSLRPGKDGTFHWTVTRSGVEHVLWAEDPAKQHAPGPVVTAMPGDRNVLLSLGAYGEILLRVEDEQGAPIEAFTVRVSSPEMIRRLDSQGDRGVARVTVPDGPCKINVLAEGYFAAELGPEQFLDGQILECTLKRRAAITGRVIDRSGSGVAGARVSVMKPLPERRMALVGGWPSKVLPSVHAKAVTGREGHFELALRGRAEYLLRAERQGFAPVVTAPMVLDGERGSGDIVIVMDDASAELEGSVTDGKGRAISGAIVGASCGDGVVVSERTNDEGRYRMTDLRPGEYWVGILERDVALGVSVTRGPAGLWPVPEPDCDLKVGVNHYDLTIETARVVGQVMCDGIPLRGGGAEVSNVGWGDGFPAVSPDVASSDVSRDGRFSVDVPYDGIAYVRVRGYLDGMEVSCTRKVTLHFGEDIDASFTWRGGTLLGEVEAEIGTSVLCEGEGETGGKIQLTVHSDESGQFHMPAVPIGEVEIWIEGGRKHTVRVGPGEVTRVRL